MAGVMVTAAHHVCACRPERGELVSRQCACGQLSPCIFEYIYLARPDSVLSDIPVYSFQLGLGTRLAQRIRRAAALYLSAPWIVRAVGCMPCGRAWPSSIMPGKVCNLMEGCGSQYRPVSAR